MKQNWTYKKLGEVCEIYQPKTLATEQLIADGKYLVYGANGVIGRYNEYNHNQAEVLLTCRGATCGTINVSKPFSWINGNAMVIHRKTEELSFDFLRYLMLSLDYSLIITGAAQPQITRQKLSPTRIKFPPLPLQQSIVAELDEINNLLSLKRKELETYDKLAQSLFYEMFGDPVENEKGWEVKKLSSITTKIGSGATPKGGNESYKSEGISLIRSLNVHNNEFLYKDLAHIDNQQADALSNVEIYKDDVLLNITGASVARCCIVPNVIIPARVNQHVCIIRAMADKVLPIYLNRLLTNANYQNSLLALARSKAATREALPKSLVDNLQIPLPPLPLQQTFATRIEAIEEQKANVKAAIEKLETLLAARMQYWFE